MSGAFFKKNIRQHQFIFVLFATQEKIGIVQHFTLNGKSVDDLFGI